jgi:hypothetical protein
MRTFHRWRAHGARQSSQNPETAQLAERVLAADTGKPLPPISSGPANVLGRATPDLHGLLNSVRTELVGRR